MLQALLAGVASIKAQQTRMDVIGSNLANVNTQAYKSSRVTFEDMLAQTLRGGTVPTSSNGGQNPIQIGLGVIVGSTDVNMTQGSLNATNRPTDLAIQGNGFFMTSNSQAVSYTRDGSMNLDANGNLVHSATGERVLGWKADAFGNVDSTTPITPASSIQIPLGRLNAVQQTNKVTLAGNLNGASFMGTLPGPVGADSWSTQMKVYDSIGGAHDLTVVFTNRKDGSPGFPLDGTPPAGAVTSWEWKAYEGDPATGTPIGDWTSAGNQPMFFDASGKILNGAIAGGTTVPPSTGAPAFKVALDFSGVGQLKSASQVNESDQNGFPPGTLQGFTINPDGSVAGLFTNGLSRTFGQLAMAVFPNPAGLSHQGNNLWAPADNSGIPVVGTPTTGGRGNVSAGFLEQSNVDISSEFTDLIVTQRGFQANTKIVTTVDEMITDLINMKR